MPDHREPLKRALVAAVLAAALAPAPAPAREPRAPAAPEEIVAYRESGEWRRDTATVAGRARRALAATLGWAARERPAMVLDVDDTSLSNYRCLRRAGFDRTVGDCGATGRLPPIRPTRALHRYARRNGVTVFFVTGRRERLRQTTRANLGRAGYRGRLRLRMRPDGQRPEWRDGWKARTRRSISRHGFRIAVNLGDQRSDLRGGHAARAFKLPNPMYVIATA